MKAALCVLLMAAAALGAEEKKTEKRGAFGLGYGLGAPGPLLGAGYYGGHGLGLYGHGVGGLGWGHAALAPAPLLGHGYSAPLVGHGYSAPLLGHGYSAPLLGHSVSYGAPLLGLGHGVGYGGYGGWH